jgi:hypothetical protein
MKQFFLVLLGPSWKSTLAGLGEAIAVQALTYTLNTQYHDPRVFWSGMGLSLLTLIREQFTNPDGSFATCCCSSGRQDNPGSQGMILTRIIIIIILLLLRMR